MPCCLAAVLTGWTPIFAILIFGALIVLAPVLFGARRVAGQSAEESDVYKVSDPNEPPDASPKAPHGYTPSV